MTSAQSRITLSREEELELLRRARKLCDLRTDSYRLVQLGRFTIDTSYNGCVIIHETSTTCKLIVYSQQTRVGYIDNPEPLRELIQLMRATMILDDLANV